MKSASVSQDTEPTLYKQTKLTNKTNNLKDWPGAFGIYKTSKTAVMKNLKTAISLVVIEGLITILYVVILAGTKKNSSARDLIELIFAIINYLVTSTIIFTMIKSVRNKTVSVSEAYSNVFSNTANIVFVSILYLIISMLSVALFVIPAFFIIPRVYLSIYFVIDKEMGPIEAVKSSWEATRGHVGKIYGILGVNILIILPIITLIGIIATVYFGFMYFAASAVLYNYITTSKKSLS
jgi:uncharacterized membrane protein